VVVGTRTLTIADAVARRTDAPTSFFELAPALFITPSDLDASGLLSPGSRSINTLYINLPPGADPRAALPALKAAAAEETAEAGSWATDNPGTLRFLQTTLRFMGFLGLLLLALGGVGVATALSAALAAARRETGMLLALGAPRAWLVKAWSLWAGLLVAGGVALATAMGGLGTRLLAGLFAGWTGLSAAAPSWGALSRAAGPASAATVFFAGAPLLALLDLPPNAVLSEDARAPRRPGRAAAVAGTAMAAFFLLAWAQLGRPREAAWALAGGAALLAAAWALSTAGLAAARFFLSRRRGVTARLAARGLERPGALNRAVGASLALSLALVLGLFLLEKNLRVGLTEAAPPDLPNVFFVNVKPGEEPLFQKTAGTPVRLFPLIRGRVTAVDGVPVRRVQARSDRGRQGGDRLTREFGFTFGDELLPTDRVVDGSGLWDGRVEGPQVSVFDQFQKRFGIHRGSRITVNVLGRRMTATVTSLRSINQSVRQPFFYFQFKPGSLEGAPYTLMGGAHLPREEIVPAEKRLALALPDVTVIDLSEVAALTNRVLGRLAAAARALGGLGAAGGLVLLAANLGVTLLARTRESVLYRCLGATTGQVARVYGAEFAALGAVAAAGGGLLGQGAAWGLTRWGLDLPFHPYLGVTAAVLGGAAAVVVSLSFAAAGRALRAAPMEVLRHE
jgi:putative ABC transport system permease protein